MRFLEELGFDQRRKSKRYWYWKKDIFVSVRSPDDKDIYGKTLIVRKPKIDMGDKRNNVVFFGRYIFENKSFTYQIFKNTGILEFIKETRIVEKKTICHEPFLKQIGFEQIDHNVWVKNIYCIAIKPPKFQKDRGKCLIMKKPNVKKLMDKDQEARIVYKGRYFFDNKEFSENLFTAISFYDFDTGTKNKDYVFKREIEQNTNRFIDEIFLEF